MNVSLDTASLLMMILNFAFIVIGVLIKMELHDIKSRIVRLEDKLMKSLIPLIFVLSLGVTIDGHAVTQVQGGATFQPGSTEILCQAPKFCPRVVAPDWSTGGSTMYGTDPTCRKSIDGGRNWLACPTQPSATNSNYSITVAKNGAVIWGGNDAGGTVFNIRRSTDGGVSWSTAYTTATISTYSASTNSLIKCAETSTTCVAFYISAGNTVQVLTSIDNGQTWAPGTNGTMVDTPAVFTLSNDGAHGIAPPNAPNGSLSAIVFTSGTWHRSSIPWVTSAGGGCVTAFVIQSVNRTICNDTTLGTDITLRNEDGLVQSTFNLSARFAGANTNLIANAADLTTGKAAMVGTNNSGSTSVWVSSDAGNSWTAEGTLTEQILDPYDSFSIQGCVYFSYLASGLNGRLTKVCP